MVSKERWFNTAQNLQGLGLEKSSKLSMKKAMFKSIYVYYEKKKNILGTGKEFDILGLFSWILFSDRLCLVKLVFS